MLHSTSVGMPLSFQCRKIAVFAATYLPSRFLCRQLPYIRSTKSMKLVQPKHLIYLRIHLFFSTAFPQSIVQYSTLNTDELNPSFDCDIPNINMAVLISGT
ncbi:hypothetical protein KIL84_011247 [Mauremys mutica]|uniref:Uncharacterized protein n=1 Tax=Mauremys mutica TaxID=74926 RepID=A0A9D3XEH4_9SAUR|nr:hypothetical protein KIL84_011247 [Mauremys mutica]